MIAGVLLKVGPGKVKSVLEAIRKIDKVKYAYGVFGRYDIVVMIEAENLNELTKIIVENIGQIEGVISTETLIKADI